MTDSYREWLRLQLAAEVGVREAEQTIESSIVRRGWPAMRPLGSRDVVAVLQDVYTSFRNTMGDARADRWLEGATTALASFAESTPSPAPASTGTIAPAPGPVRWGRRAHDLPLLLARAHAEIAVRSLEGIRANPDLKNLERAAEWDVQATQAEVRRWETEELLSNLRADHARVEVADQVRSARSQREVLRLTVEEVEGEARAGRKVGPQMAHNKLMLSQTDAFLDAFAPLIDETVAAEDPKAPNINLDSSRFALAVPMHPNVLRARHQLNYAEWQAGGVNDGRVQNARAALVQAEREATAQTENTLGAARAHQAAFQQLMNRFHDAQLGHAQLSRSGADALTLARHAFDAEQARLAARVQAHRLNEALRLLNALTGNAE
ncbi:hypothetical protein EHF33_06215 [Deinococcus psychrotolerans]|uniref:TolC family protein n=1 Tax=Deinococcus psychrotolerans TaxID=2489213 RepID=A0A3G8YBE4_9DEIO|nr:hypothetical protein [Deinococcus psychrotolerans]AZI42395.1 hypothetical protein EHF33_06215 [Deinococcus psychrotolerans]